MKTRSYRQVTFEVKIDVSHHPDRLIEDELQRALEFARFAGDRIEIGEWVMVPYSQSDYGQIGPTFIRASAASFEEES